jgi:hypothetical protein
MDDRRLPFTGVLRSCAAGVSMTIIIACALVCGTYSLIRAASNEELKPRPLPKIYPGAQEVEEKVVSRGGEAFAGDLDMRVVSFSTSHPAEDVLAYYLDTMKKAGWKHWGTDEEDSGGLRKVDAYFAHSPDEGPTYRVSLKTTTSVSRPTGVTLEMFAAGSDWHGDPMTENSR